MAEHGEEDTEYESDPEETKLSLKMRRREASDDEGEVDGDVMEKSDRSGVDSGGESDGQEGAAEYNDEELEGDEDEEEYYDDEEEEIEAEKEVEENCGDGEVLELEQPGASEGHGDDAHSQVQEEEKKLNDPLLVPTAGAFYMHDDRYKGNTGGRNRHTFSGRKLWESKDDKKWGHDKFEEMNVDRQYDERRNFSRGSSRGRGRGRGADLGFVRGNRSRLYNGNNNQNIVPKTVRGRGPIRYQAVTRDSSEAPAPQNKQSRKHHDKGSYGSSGRAVAHTDSHPLTTKIVASNLNSASPPFYPSRTSNKENRTLTQKRSDQAVSTSRAIRPSMRGSLSVQQPNSLLRGKTVSDSVGMEKLYIDQPSLARSIENVHMPSASLPANVSRSREQGVGVPLSGSNSAQVFSNQDEVRRRSSTAQSHPALWNHVPRQGQTYLPVSAHQLGQRSDSASHRSSPPQAGLPLTAMESGEEDSLGGSGKLKAANTALVGKGKETAQGGQRGSFLYGAGQLMGSSGTIGDGQGDQNFPAAPAFLPVMQFGGQSSGGVGVPAVGMAFPGYVGNGQSQHGLGNSEMTWLPVLTGAAGSLGTSYCPPYLAFDGNYHALPAGQPPASSKDDNVNKTNDELVAQQKSDEKFNQRQNKPRRYSEMSFEQ